jgi:hypothetical protein
MSTARKVPSPDSKQHDLFGGVPAQDARPRPNASDTGRRFVTGNPHAKPQASATNHIHARASCANTAETFCDSLFSSGKNSADGVAILFLPLLRRLLLLDVVPNHPNRRTATTSSKVAWRPKSATPQRCLNGRVMLTANHPTQGHHCRRP